MTKKELLNALDNRKDRSAWDKGVTIYAYELVEGLKLEDNEELVKNENISKTILLNGADSWGQYSWGGSSLIYDADIAKRLCTPSELKTTRNGERKPNATEEWLDIQARALSHASNRIMRTLQL